MPDTRTAMIGFGLILLGLLLIVLRSWMVPRLADFYRRRGIDFPLGAYMKQFVFIGFVLMLLGFLVVTDLLQLL